MPKLEDCLVVGVNNSSAHDSAWYVKFAFGLHMDVSKARKLFEKYGRGNIYSSGGFVMPDTPKMRCKMVANFGECVVVPKDGEMFVRKPSDIGRQNRKRAFRLDKKKRDLIERDELALRERHRLMSSFEDAMTQHKPQKKHEGKAKSHADIGKYVWHRGAHIDRMEKRAEDRFVVINIKY